MNTSGWLGLLSAGALVPSFVWRPSALPSLDLCLFHRLTGFPCPGCGLTHSFCAISHGDFAAAWAYNPFGYVFYGLAVILLLHLLLARFSTSYERLIPRHHLAWVSVPALAVAMWAFGLLRILRQISV